MGVRVELYGKWQDISHMTTHVAEHFRKMRLQKGLKLSEVAMRMGYRRTARSLSHGCNRLQKFETTGDIDSRLFTKLAAVLEHRPGDDERTLAGRP